MKTEKQVTAEGMKETLKALLRENVVGLIQEETENGFVFSLPYQTSFSVAVEEK